MLRPVSPVAPGFGRTVLPGEGYRGRLGLGPRRSSARTGEGVSDLFLSFPSLELLSLSERRLVGRYKALFEGFPFGFKIDIYA